MVLAVYCVLFFFCVLCAFLCFCVFLFFFFQAEDGIRDLIVTGVQTCALPISRRIRGRWRRSWSGCTRGAGSRPGSRVSPAPASEPGAPLRRRRRRGVSRAQIGRASCRERV